MEKEIINRVESSPLLTLDLENLYTKGERVVFDLKKILYEGIILKEKEFRLFIKTNDWTNYQDKHVAVHCSVDAIIPTWAYMLLAVKLEPYAASVVYGDLTDLESYLFFKALSRLNINKYAEKKVVIKGCGKLNVPTSAYVELTRMLRPVAASIMYGEPCSTVPVYKKLRA
jgi:hypothetical protein